MCPDRDMDVTTDSGSPTSIVDYPVRFPDNVDYNASASCHPPPGYPFEVGKTVVSCWVVDSSNNTANCSFTINVTGKQNTVAAI